jgi:hypothetical protein
MSELDTGDFGVESVGGLNIDTASNLAVKRGDGRGWGVLVIGSPIQPYRLMS